MYSMACHIENLKDASAYLKKNFLIINQIQSAPRVSNQNVLVLIYQFILCKKARIRDGQIIKEFLVSTKYTSIQSKITFLN